ncbi:hypothetical protein [Ornithinicoccus hortensis]|uniref:Uncharacterized protein n=1 Tax=Ornithinicoccus hortensis TaxID=82346 RepID=A0A542YQU2_9MICO|nr:hypothetical protein [Ornithinicoccus hortensis]TQL50431.1 hypothetical protein FB467_1540 [Ornithinicoccus hortensis]
MAIRIVTSEDDPEGNPIRYVRLSTDVTKVELSTWADSLPGNARLTIESRSSELSRTEIVDVVSPHVTSVRVTIADLDD